MIKDLFMKNLINFLKENKFVLIVATIGIILIFFILKYFAIPSFKQLNEKAKEKEKHKVEIIWSEGVRNSNFGLNVTKIRVENHEYYIFKHSNCPNFEVIRGTIYNGK